MSYCFIFNFVFKSLSYVLVILSWDSFHISGLLNCFPLPRALLVELKGLLAAFIKVWGYNWITYHTNHDNCFYNLFFNSFFFKLIRFIFRYDNWLKNGFSFFFFILFFISSSFLYICFCFIKPIACNFKFLCSLLTFFLDFFLNLSYLLSNLSISV